MSNNDNSENATTPVKRTSFDPRDDLILARKNFKIYCSGIRYSWNEEDIRHFFQEYGKVVAVIIPIRKNGTRPGFAIIYMERESDGRAAIRALNGAKIQNFILHVSEYQQKTKEDYERDRNSDDDRNRRDRNDRYSYDRRDYPY